MATARVSSNSTCTKERHTGPLNSPSILSLQLAPSLAIRQEQIEFILQSCTPTPSLSIFVAVRNRFWLLDGNRPENTVISTRKIHLSHTLDSGHPRLVHWIHQNPQDSGLQIFLLCHAFPKVPILSTLVYKMVIPKFQANGKNEEN